MADAPDTKDAPEPPPNLRMSSEKSKECGNCEHYVHEKCAKYDNLPVDDEWVCDSWAKGNQGDADDAEDEDSPDENASGTMTEAKVRVREHMRRLRKAAQASGD